MEESFTKLLTVTFFAKRYLRPCELSGPMKFLPQCASQGVEDHELTCRESFDSEERCEGIMVSGRFFCPASLKLVIILLA